jgi:hypothetical protein
VRITSGDGWAGSGFAVMAVLWGAEWLLIRVEGRRHCSASSAFSVFTGNVLISGYASVAPRELD